MTQNTEPVIANKIRCICCGQEATSTHRHDFQQLPNCRNGSTVDGGNDYTRILGKDITLIETWNSKEQRWNESDNQLAKDLFRNGKYDFPAYSRAKDFDFGDYQDKRDAAMNGLKEAFFAKYDLKGRDPASQDYNNKPERLFYNVWHMPLDDKRDPDPRDVYFLFIHFVDLLGLAKPLSDGNDYFLLDVPVTVTARFARGETPEGVARQIRNAVAQVKMEADTFLPDGISMYDIKRE